MTSPVFDANFYEQSSRDNEAQLKTFQAAVMSARAGNDETVKQVGIFLILRFLSLLIKSLS